MDLPFRACRIKQAQKTGSSGKFLLNTESCTISSPRTKRRVQRIVLAVQTLVVLGLTSSENAARCELWYRHHIQH